MPGARKTLVGFWARENSPLSKVHSTWETLPVMLEVKWTRSGAAPLVTSAAAWQVGWPARGFFRNHGVAVGSVLENAKSSWATLGTPPVSVGWVEWFCTSEPSQANSCRP